MPSGTLKPMNNLVGNIGNSGGTKDHDRLVNRDLPDQHPIKSITGLEDALNNLDQAITETKTEVIETIVPQIEELSEKVDDISIEELSKRPVIKVYTEEPDDKWILAETFNPIIVYYERLEEDDAIYYRRVILNEHTFEPNIYYYYKETGINQEQPTTRSLLRANTPIANTEVEKEEGYYPAYEYNENETYYELVYDSNPNNLIGIWQWNDNLIPAVHTNEADRAAGLEHTDFIWERGTFVWYDNSGRRYEHHAVGIIGYNWLMGGYSGWRYRRFWDSMRGEWMQGTDICPLGLGYGEANGVSWCGMQFGWAALYPKKDLIQQWKDSDISDEKGDFKTVEDYRTFLDHLLNGGKTTDSTYWYNSGMKKLWITEVRGSIGGGSLLTYIKQNAVKLSDELLPYGDNNYKTKYVEVEVTPETFEPGKYYTYYTTPKEIEEVTTQRMILSKTFVNTENYYAIDRYSILGNKPIYKQVVLTEQEFYDNYQTDYYKVLIEQDRVQADEIIRIQLDPEESIYRDYDGNDVLKIVDNNVLINGDPLYPKLTTSDNNFPAISLENNAEETYTELLNGIKITIPNNVKHGFCSYLVFEPANSNFIFNLNNNSRYNLKIIMFGSQIKLDELEFNDGCQYNLLFLCNGNNLELYIQEIQLVS